MAAYKILIVDDDPSILRSLGAYFEKLGHEVFRAESGEQGIAEHERVHPDVTILDVFMPGMSGMEALEILRSRQATVIVLTGQGQLETAVEAMQLGAENFLVKPVDLGHLSVAVEKAAEKAALRRENLALKRRLHPNLKRRMVRIAILVVMIVASAGIGLLIGGGGKAEPARSPIPIPVDSLS